MLFDDGWRGELEGKYAYGQRSRKLNSYQPAVAVYHVKAPLPRQQKGLEEKHGNRAQQLVARRPAKVCALENGGAVDGYAVDSLGVRLPRHPARHHVNLISARNALRDLLREQLGAPLLRGGSAVSRGLFSQL